MPPLLVVLFVTRRPEGEDHLPRDSGDRGGVPPRVAVVRGRLVHPIELPAEREGAARLLGALALPAWAYNEKSAPRQMGPKQGAEDVHRSMKMSSASESRARQDLGAALEAAGLRPSDYLDIDLKGKRQAFRELRNARDDVSLLDDADDLGEVGWILDSARLGGDGEPDVAMGWLWDPASKDHALAGFANSKLALRVHRARRARAGSWLPPRPRSSRLVRGRQPARTWGKRNA